MENSKVVIGNGWAALGAVAQILPDHPVIWISGSRTRMAPVLPGLDPGPAVEVLKKLCQRWGIELGEVTDENSLREYRGKAFKTPKWSKSGEEELWGPERQWTSAIQARAQQALCEIEDLLYRKILAQTEPKMLRRIEGLPVTSVGNGADGKLRVVLGSGEEIPCSEIYYADRWSLLMGLDGIPHPVTFLRKRGGLGALQASFVHKVPVGQGVLESFVAGLHREAGEDVERHVWGYFFSGGMRSSWTIALTSEEVEDNHTVAKKFRRMKSTLDRVFAGSEIVPQGFETFGATLEDEQVRFEEEAVFSEGEPLTHALCLPERPHLFFMTDGYGPTSSLLQVGSIGSNS